MNVIDTIKKLCYLVKETFFYFVLDISFFLQVWTLRPFFISCFLNLNVKSSNLNESNTSPVFSKTSSCTVDMFSLLNPFFLLLRRRRRDLTGVLS